MSPSRALRAAARAGAALLLVLLCSGCAVGRYVRDRALDVTDIIDIKYGTCIGVGAKAEITHFLGAGAGAAALGVQREWYGRRSIKSRGFAFAHAGAIGVDGGFGSPNPEGWSDEPADVYFLLVNGTALADFLVAPGGDARIDLIDVTQTQRRRAREAAADPDAPPAHPPTPPLVDRWRIGAEVLIPAVNFGLYVNLGEVADLVLGLFTIDIADDDGVSKGELYALPPRVHSDETIVW